MIDRVADKRLAALLRESLDGDDVRQGDPGFKAEQVLRRAAGDIADAIEGDMAEMFGGMTYTNGPPANELEFSTVEAAVREFNQENRAAQDESDRKRKRGKLILNRRIYGDKYDGCINEHEGAEYRIFSDDRFAEKDFQGNPQHIHGYRMPYAEPLDLAALMPALPPIDPGAELSMRARFLAPLRCDQPMYNGVFNLGPREPTAAERRRSRKKTKRRARMKRKRKRGYA